MGVEQCQQKPPEISARASVLILVSVFQLVLELKTFS